jgi:uncharacterized protein YqgC (DUF456 family)
VRGRLRLAFDWTAGVALIVVGLLGLVVPILPGVLFLVAGVAILSSRSRLVHALQLRAQALARKLTRRGRDGG